jgi:hypothetical protein
VYGGVEKGAGEGEEEGGREGRRGGGREERRGREGGGGGERRRKGGGGGGEKVKQNASKQCSGCTFAIYIVALLHCSNYSKHSSKVMYHLKLKRKCRQMGQKLTLWIVQNMTRSKTQPTARTKSIGITTE